MYIHLKYCYVCKTYKFLEDFHKRKMSLDGLTKECKKCKLAYMKEYNKKNKVNIQAKNKKYYLLNAQKLKKAASLYYFDNKERINLRDQKYYVENKERILIQKKVYTEQNKNKTKLG